MALLSAIILVAAGCTDDDDAEPDAAPGPDTTAPPATTATPTAGTTTTPETATTPAEATTTVAPADTGSYTSQHFQPPITFEVPEGWEIEFDEPHGVHVRTEDPFPGGVYMVRDPVALRPDPQGDTSEIAAGAGSTAGELVEWLVEHPELDVTEPAGTTVGGIDATRVDVRLAADSTSSQPAFSCDPCADLIGTDPEDPEQVAFWLSGPDKTKTVVLMTAPDGATVAILAFANDQAADVHDQAMHTAFVELAQPVLDSITFD